MVITLARDDLRKRKAEHIAQPESDLKSCVVIYGTLGFPWEYFLVKSSIFAAAHPPVHPPILRGSPVAGPGREGEVRGVH